MNTNEHDMATELDNDMFSNPEDESHDVSYRSAGAQLNGNGDDFDIHVIDSDAPAHEHMTSSVDDHDEGVSDEEEDEEEEEEEEEDEAVDEDMSGEDDHRYNNYYSESYESDESEVDMRRQLRRGQSNNPTQDSSTFPLDEFENSVRRFFTFSRQEGSQLGSTLGRFAPFGNLPIQFRQILIGLTDDSDPSAQMVALQELSEILVISTEDILQGLFSVEPFVREFNHILANSSSMELMLMCMTCLSNMLEAFPSSIAVVANSPIVSTLCVKMFDMQYIDMTEQALNILLRISEKFGDRIVTNRGLLAALQYLDFFYTGVQRVAISMAANCCKFLREKDVDHVKEAYPHLITALQMADTTVRDKAYECVENIMIAFEDNHDIMKSFVNTDLISSIVASLETSQFSKMQTTSQPRLFSILTCICSVSENYVQPLLEMHLSDIIYELLCGIPPPESFSHNSMVAMQSLFHCPNELISNVLSLICSLLQNCPEVSKTGENSAGTTNALVRTLLPVVMDIYSTTTDKHNRELAVIAALRMINSVDNECLQATVKSLPISAFLASILTLKSKEYALLENALLMAIALLERMPEIYKDLFIREGVVQEVSYMSSALSAELKKLRRDSSGSYENVFQLGMLQKWEKSFLSFYRDDELVNPTLEKLTKFAKSLVYENDYERVFAHLVEVYEQRLPVTSYELLQSGLIPSLLKLLSKGSVSVVRKFFQAFNKGDEHHVLDFTSGSLSRFITSLQELLSRIEKFEISIIPTSSPSQNLGFLSKQYRLKLVPSPTVNESLGLRSFMVSINGLDSLSTLEDYMKGKLFSRRTLENRLSSLHEGTATPIGNTSLTNRIANEEDSASNRSPSVNHDASPTDSQSSSSDTHLSFYFDGKPVNKNFTIFKVILESLKPKGKCSMDDVLNACITLNYNICTSADEPEVTPTVEAFQCNPDLTNVLQLLKTIYDYLSDLESVFPSRHLIGSLENLLTEFNNWKLSAKLNRQLEEPLIVLHQCLPRWCLHIASNYPFLFPFETRYILLQFTAFGMGRAINYWLSVHPVQTNDENSTVLQLVKLNRQKLRISRNQIFEYAKQVLFSFGSSKNIIEIEYEDEVGSGLGPTQEFYTTVSREFTRKHHHMWRDDNQTSNYVHSATGLFPAPMSHAIGANEKICSLFKMLGQFIARSLYDSRLISVQLNPLIFEETIPLTLSSVSKVDKELGKSLRFLERLLARQQAGFTAVPTETKIEDLCLDFTLPGYPSVELIPNGRNVQVSHKNASKYISSIIDFTVGKGVQLQIQNFREGFSTVFNYESLRIITSHELSMLFGKVEEDWSFETIAKSIVADHGYNMENTTIHNLIEVMSNFSFSEQRDFLQFITGSRKLPIGGFSSLHPALTVVRKLNEPPYVPDDYLPSVMTCVNYLKLPEYSSKEILKQKLMLAMKEGQGSFHLS
ncbi:ubiquitin-protein ligase E3 [Schizosaccharomyces japonicus yFS275]|uniref:HECT-type E3 ubiquitin transferase n=1 Tax=Schizosaccharomyces japonicus (strain yFS275 / FY16936) TaxID=402676 RepID=B6JZ75_SCHJY|nr:ubiquitin-protein ligase E3 [Schizosaccharomyces japonicus yFS275]EEB06843.1 ubiquitin-protein ligase E3 [Schizosaccharomyces japonicus yFS275]